MSKLPYFDPRQIPVAGVDAHLPAVAHHVLQPAALRQRFISPPVWTPELVAEKTFSERQPIHASVLLPIVMREQPTVLLTERTMHLSTHSGQIAFPGGKADEEDADASATALREAQEEIGLDPAFVQVLGHMPHYITGSAFIITPVVALVETGFKLTPNANEVADIFEVPLAFLMNPAHHQRHAFEWEGARREWFSMPYLEQMNGQTTQRFIWGATAGMLRNFYRLLSA
ncbi:CoA pyrophosphatase [Rhodoferax sp.]|uniref:CoA pyrophosphatase n=1 Tax=Rhodoferax sp. TaxID=50421 RepID=UPI001ED353E8|nr:CoA pyrophosphatase [Rhodoferax sp.]MBT9507189.1 CoA pyrophosphatase [Rhodoferax sp.]